MRGKQFLNGAKDQKLPSTGARKRSARAPKYSSMYILLAFIIGQMGPWLHVFSSTHSKNQQDRSNQGLIHTNSRMNVSVQGSPVVLS